MPKRKGNYFPLPNEIFNMDLSAAEIALYAFLMRMEDRKTFQCYPAFETIGEAVGMGSKNTVMKYVRMLEEKELIETKHTVVEHHDGTLRNGKMNWMKCGVKPSIMSAERAVKSSSTISQRAGITTNKSGYSQKPVVYC